MKVGMLVMDVDGTLTDGRIYMGSDGEAFKAFDCKDGYAIAQMLPKLGIVPVIITGRRSAIVANRAQELHIEELYQGVEDKLSCLRSIAQRKGLRAEQLAYIGDDLNDLDCIRFCGVTACPRDAAQEIREAVDYVCASDGGRGAVREFVQWLAKREW